MMQLQWQQQMMLVLGDYMKIAIWWGEHDTFDRGGCKFGGKKALASLICCTCLTITVTLIWKPPANMSWFLVMLFKWINRADMSQN